MSTRANILIKDRYNRQIWLYRHSDGYPEATMTTLQKFIEWHRSSAISGDPSQVSGWLILLGAIEYQTLPPLRFHGEKTISKDVFKKLLDFEPEYHKSSAYEPTDGCHGDIRYLYIIDLDEQSISCYGTGDFDVEGSPTCDPMFVDTEDNPWCPEDEETQE